MSNKSFDLFKSMLNKKKEIKNNNKISLIKLERAHNCDW